MGQAEYLYGRYWEREVSAPPEHDPTTPRRIVLLKRALKGLAPGAKVLDAGCGGGIFLREMISWGFDVTGTDISQGALTLAASRAPGARLVQAELGMRLPFNDSEFQAIFSTETIEHVLDTETLFAEFRRILTDGGLLILTTPYHGLVKNLLIALFAFDKHYSPLGTHLRYYTRRSLEAVLTAYGFRVERVAGVGTYLAALEIDLGRSSEAVKHMPGGLEKVSILITILNEGRDQLPRCLRFKSILVPGGVTGPD